MTGPTLADQLQLLHELIYTAQVTRNHEQHEAITRARVLLSHIRTELATQQPAPPAPADSVPHTAAPVWGATPGEWFVRKLEKDGVLKDCFVAAPDFTGCAYDAEILGDDEYRSDVLRKLADCELIVTAVKHYRATHAPHVDSVTKPPAPAQSADLPPLQFCRNCGEGVTSFCRSKTESDCLKGLPRVPRP